MVSHTHRRVLAAGDREHGASVHFVTPELDGGPVVLQARVPVLPGDDEETLAARVLEQEHVIYAQCIGWFATSACASTRAAHGSTAACSILPSCWRTIRDARADGY